MSKGLTAAAWLAEDQSRFLALAKTMRRHDLTLTGMTAAGYAGKAPLEKIFEAKKVPLELLLNIKDEADFHRLDFQAVMATVATDIELHEFDYYFNYVVKLAESLKTALERKASSDH